MRTSTSIISIRVPTDIATDCLRVVHGYVYERKKNALYLYIKGNPKSTIEQVRAHFGYKKRAASIINMCYRTGLSLKDLPKK